MKDPTQKPTTPYYLFVFILISFKTFPVSPNQSHLIGEGPNENLPPPPINSTRLPEHDELYSKCNGIDVRELTILQIQELFARNILTSVMLTNCYLERIHHMNGELKGVIEVNPDATKEALKADLGRASGTQTELGRMHGIPVLLKDNIGTADLMETTTGSLAFVGIKPKEDSDVVKALRKAGAVILGKANLSEFSMFRGRNVPTGWSGRGGHTRNAYSLNEIPGGSSSGSATTVAANLCTVAVGTETDGSLIAPASMTGICAMKPTLGMSSCKGIIPISHNQDTTGPMARTVNDLAILLDAMIPQHEQKRGSYFDSLVNRPPLHPFRIGVPRFPFWNTTAINSTNLRAELPQLQYMLKVLNHSRTFEVIDPIEYDINLIKKISTKDQLTLLTHDFKHDLNLYLSEEVISSKSHITPIRKIETLKDIIQFNLDNPNPEGYNQEYLVMSEATDGLQNETYIKARNANRKSSVELIEHLMTTHHLDAIVMPSEPRFEGILEEGIRESPVTGFSIAAYSGYPSINIPAGLGDKGVPFGIMFIGRPYTEHKLLQIAYAAEQINPQRRPPKFLI